MMKKTDARVRYTKKILKESLLKLLQEKPINKVTVKEVCALAELNRATFYAHYSDCFDLLESIEDELVEAFEQALILVKSLDVSAMISALYNIVENNEAACRVLIFQNTSTPVLQRMISLAREKSIAFWKSELAGASDEDLELLYTHLSNGLMHVVVEGYVKYSKEAIAAFVNRIVKSSLSGFALCQGTKGAC